MADRVSAGVELAFDSNTEDRIRGVWQRLEDLGVPTLRTHTHRQHRPHLTVVVDDWLDLTAVRKAMPALPLPLPVTFRWVGQFPGGILWLGVVVTAELLDLHRRIHERLNAAGISGCSYYRPGRWTPHCTLSMAVSDDRMATATRLVCDLLPVTGQIETVDLVRHTTDTAEYHQLYP